MGQTIMTSNAKHKLTLDQPVTYQIKVPGELNESWSERYRKMTIKIENKKNILPITTLTATVDQAALHGLLRQLYSLGLPIISVVCTDLNLEIHD